MHDRSRLNNSIFLAWILILHSSRYACAALYVAQGIFSRLPSHYFFMKILTCSGPGYSNVRIEYPHTAPYQNTLLRFIGSGICFVRLVSGMRCSEMGARSLDVVGHKWSESAVHTDHVKSVHFVWLLLFDSKSDIPDMSESLCRMCGGACHLHNAAERRAVSSTRFSAGKFWPVLALHVSVQGSSWKITTQAHRRQRQRPRRRRWSISCWSFLNEGRDRIVVEMQRSRHSNFGFFN